MPCPSFDTSCWNSHFCSFVFFFLVLSNGATLGVKLKLALEGIDPGCHGHDLFIIGRFGSPLTRVFEIVEVGLAIGHESLVGHGE